MEVNTRLTGWMFLRFPLCYLVPAPQPERNLHSYAVSSEYSKNLLFLCTLGPFGLVGTITPFQGKTLRKVENID